MKIRVRLFAAVKDIVGQREVVLDVPEGTTLEAVLGRFPLPRALVHLVLVNGEYVLPEERAARVLQEGDAVAIWPPIAGG